MAMTVEPNITDQGIFLFHDIADAGHGFLNGSCYDKAELLSMKKLIPPGLGMKTHQRRVRNRRFSRQDNVEPFLVLWYTVNVKSDAIMSKK
jgi:hypothetical protein